MALELVVVGGKKEADGSYRLSDGFEIHLVVYGGGWVAYHNPGEVKILVTKDGKKVATRTINAHRARFDDKPAVVLDVIYKPKQDPKASKRLFADLKKELVKELGSSKKAKEFFAEFMQVPEFLTDSVAHFPSGKYSLCARFEDYVSPFVEIEIKGEK